MPDITPYRQIEKLCRGVLAPGADCARHNQSRTSAVLDAYTEEEQAAGFLTMIEEHLAFTFSVKILGVDADVEKVDMTLDGQIVGICRRGKTRQKESERKP